MNLLTNKNEKNFSMKKILKDSYLGKDVDMLLDNLTIKNLNFTYFTLIALSFPFLFCFCLL